MDDQVATVPEPATVTLVGAGTLTLLGYGWRRRQLIAGRANALTESPSVAI
jgi:hypothetical protein